MIALEQETNADVLREFALLMQAELLRAHAKIDQLRESNEERALSKQDWLNTKIKDELHRLQKKFYGFGRESIKSKDSPRRVGHAKQELLFHTDRAQDHAENVIHVQGVPRHQNPVAELHYFLDELLMEESKSRGVAAGKEAWKQMENFYQESAEITVTEKVYQKVVHKPTPFG